MYDAFAEMLKPSGHGFAYRQAQHDTSPDLLTAIYLSFGKLMQVWANLEVGAMLG